MKMLSAMFLGGVLMVAATFTGSVATSTDANAQWRRHGGFFHQRHFRPYRMFVPLYYYYRPRPMYFHRHHFGYRSWWNRGYRW